MRNRATTSYEYNAICDICGFKMKASQLLRRWDGFMVCKQDYETRHPSDFYTARNDTHVLPWTRPDTTDSNGDFFVYSVTIQIPTP